mmetsp:Transcript_236/g.602  ORF Transcript_236/g.602 Transcript_236/m.602 type:complete len:433 (+) Transcript_236:1-1299(+)
MAQVGSSSNKFREPSLRMAGVDRACDESHPMTEAVRCYISEAGARNVLEYRYGGCDNSLVYRYFCSPLAESLVQRFVPLSVAPNLITCLGLLPTLLGHALIWFYCADLKSSCPSWCWAAVGICTFLYQTVDNMDGKQARRTGTSSALGLLLDHEADALTIVIGSMNVAAMFQAGDSRVQCLIIWFTGALPFFFATWEEYHTGVLHLGILNGPTDGVLIMVAAQLVTAYAEEAASFWNATLVLGYSRKVCVLAFYVVCVFFTVLANFVSVHRTCVAQPADAAAGGARFLAAVRLTVPFSASCVGGAAWLAGFGSSVFADEPRLLFWLLGVVFLNQVAHLQLAHLCGEVYRPWRLTFIVPFVLIVSNNLAAWLLRNDAAVPQPPMDERLLVLGCIAGSLLAWLHFVWNVTQEMASVLGIRIFDISSAAAASKRS